jgi:hypothetical protein
MSVLKECNIKIPRNKDASPLSSIQGQLSRDKTTQLQNCLAQQQQFIQKFNLTDTAMRVRPSQTVKYGHETRGTLNQESLC